MIKSDFDTFFEELKPKSPNFDNTSFYLQEWLINNNDKLVQISQNILFLS